MSRTVSDHSAIISHGFRDSHSVGYKEVKTPHPILFSENTIDPFISSSGMSALLSSLVVPKRKSFLTRYLYCFPPTILKHNMMRLRSGI